MTADHGLLDRDESQAHEIEPKDPMVGYLKREPWGDGRAVQFDVREDDSERFSDTFRERFGDDGCIVDVEYGNDEGV